MSAPRRILPIIVISQFAGTSLWFAGNAVLGDLQLEWGLTQGTLGWMTSSVQLGFISGTLTFAFFAISDKHSPKHIFFLSSVLAALSNLGIVALDGQVFWLMFLRFFTGFFLGGIYPVGMKIASGWYQKGLGKALGFLVGALVVGTSFPHLVNSLGSSLDWRFTLVTVSILAAVGGVLMLLLVPDGPYLHAAGKNKSFSMGRVFSSRHFRAAAFGYFGHMWELYAFWTFVPFIIYYYVNNSKDAINIDVSLWSFATIAVGGISCVLGGISSLRVGSEKVAFRMLLGSALCILLSPWAYLLPSVLFLCFLLIWGYLVIGDSPQFSTLTAKTAPPDLVGSGLTIVNSIGFAISVVSIQLCNLLVEMVDPRWVFLVLLPGPVLGLVAMKPLVKMGSSDIT